MFRAVFPLIIRSSKTVHAASDTCQTCLLLPLTWMSRNSDSSTLKNIAYVASCWLCLRTSVAHKLHSRQYIRNCDKFSGTIYSARNFLYLFQFIGLNKIVTNLMEAIPLCDNREVYMYIYIYIYLRLDTTIVSNYNLII